MGKGTDAKVFTYQAKSKGAVVTGDITASNISMAKTLLRKQGIDVITIKNKGGVPKRGGSINAEDIAIFSRQIATMQSAGISLIQALNVIINGADKTSYRALITGIKEEVEAGKSFSTALKKYPLLFDELFCSLTEAGEQSGSLDTMLTRIATYKERTESLKKKVKKALYYPCAVIVIALGVSVLLLIKVVPTFKSLFDGMGAQLPTFTLKVLELSDLIKKHGIAMGIGLIISFSTFIYTYNRYKPLRHLVERLTLKMPIVKGIANNSAIAKFARTLSITFAAGVPLNEALTSVAKASGNIVYEEAILSIKEAVSGGQNLQFAMQKTGVFPAMVIQMVAIGEESGSLEKMLEKVASIYEEDVNAKVDGLTSLLEPLIMAFLGVVVGGLVIAMYLPIFKMGSIM